MTAGAQSPAGFLKTTGLLLRFAYKRSRGRRKRQQELLHARSGKNVYDWSVLGIALPVAFMLFVNGMAAMMVFLAVVAGGVIQNENQGKILVSRSFLEAVEQQQKYSASGPEAADRLNSDISREATDATREDGGDRARMEARLRDEVRNHGGHDLVRRGTTSFSLRNLATSGPFSAMLGSAVVLGWVLMLVFQGEGLELDLQRRRHPMWEWLLSHPVPPGAVFLAEMLSPLAANPMYWCAPLFPAIVYGLVYGKALGALAGLLAGVPLAVAAGCLGKALEIGVTLRLSPRSRGAMIGLMGWFGYAIMAVLFFSLFVLRKFIHSAGKFLIWFTVLPWPWLRLFVGGHKDGSFSFVSGLLACWAAAAIVIAGAVWFSVWATQQGLSGNFASAAPRPAAARVNKTRFQNYPLPRKELLWLLRDRSAIVQVILIPVSLATFQVFNLRNVMTRTGDAWNYICGAGILFGTYFLWVLGPRSLASEGNALWITLTWPRGLESLLKAKAWLWSLLSSFFVALILSYAVLLFPHDWWKIALIGVGWFLFGRSMAEKSVTLVTFTSESGEPQKLPAGRRWATQLGMLTFAIGVFTQRWQIAVAGIVYSHVTAAAMWQNFRARLPYLYDPWSEELPTPPTLLHAMVAISLLVESGAVVTGVYQWFAGRQQIAVVQILASCVCAVIVSFSVSRFLDNRGVSLRDVWTWRGSSEPLRYGLLAWLMVGAGGGLALGLCAQLYLAALNHFPAIAEMLRRQQQQMASIPHLKTSFAVAAIGFAPFAEEYLFRGLLYRALDREWGGWRAVVGSAVFFAIYHPPLSWLPVLCVGGANALLFRKSGRLAPAVVLHMVYNAVVVLG